jgi:hypothetical protein
MECLHGRHAAMPHGRLRYDIHARFGAHRCPSARVGSRDLVVDSVLIAGHAGTAAGARLGPGIRPGGGFWHGTGKLIILPERICIVLPCSHALLPQPVGQTGSACGAGPGDTDLPVADGLGPDLLRDFCQAGTSYLLISGRVRPRWRRNL